MVGDEGDVDIGLSDKEGLHRLSVMASWVVPAALHNTSVRLVESLKLFANPSFWWLEIGSGPD
jgi:hypothetical protein